MNYFSEGKLADAAGSRVQRESAVDAQSAKGLAVWHLKILKRVLCCSAWSGLAQLQRERAHRFVLAGAHVPGAVRPAFSDSDNVMVGGDQVWLDNCPGCAGQPHVTIKGCGHFLQDGGADQLTAALVEFVQKNPGAKARL